MNMRADMCAGKSTGRPRTHAHAPARARTRPQAPRKKNGLAKKNGLTKDGTHADVCTSTCALAGHTQASVHSYGPCSYGLEGLGPRIVGRFKLCKNGYGLYGSALYSYGLYSYTDRQPHSECRPPDT